METDRDIGAERAVRIPVSRTVSSGVRALLPGGGEQGDGAVSFAEVRVPLEVTISLEYPDDPNPLVRIEGAGIRALTPEVEYALQLAKYPQSPVLSFYIAFQEEPIETGWETRISMVYDRQWVQSWYNIDTNSRTGIICRAIQLLKLNLHVIVEDTAWDPPDGDYDMNVLSQPGTMHNVQNGFGFIGGGYRVKQALYPSPKAVEEACFAYGFDFGEDDE